MPGPPARLLRRPVGLLRWLPRRARAGRVATVRSRAVTAALAAVLLVGYAAGDAADVVPGPLTTAPRAGTPHALAAAPLPVAARASLASPTALPALSRTAPRPTPAALAALVTPLLAAPVLGGSAGAVVLDAATGDVLLDAGGAGARRPASVAKLLTAAAVLTRFGPDARLTTRVVETATGASSASSATGGAGGAAAPDVVLVGGGDVLLAAGAGEPGAVDGRAGLADLADAAAASLRAQGRTTITLGLDDTLVGSAPALDPTWGSSDVADGYVAPLASLAVDAGRTAPGHYAPRSADPAMAATTAFAALLGQRGITVTGSPVRTGAVAADARPLAAVESAPLGDVLAYTLAQSDNTVAESLARQVGRAAGAPATFAASAGAVLDVLRGAGLDVSGVALVDGSGLGAGSSVPPLVLARLLADATGTPSNGGHLAWRPLVAELPVGGLSGTLDARFAPGTAEDAGAGLVRAKTGTLTGVNSLAGTLVDADGRQLVFVVLADRVGATDAARAAVDAVPDALVACGCR